MTGADDAVERRACPPALQPRDRGLRGAGALRQLALGQPGPSAVEVTVRGVPVLLASLADIVRSKDAAGRDKDRRALPVPRELLARETRRRA